MSNTCAVVQKIIAKDSFDLGKLLQTMHAFFTENPNKFYTGLERNGEEFEVFVFSASLESIEEFCSYIEKNRYLKRAISFARTKSVQEDVPLVEYRRVRIKTFKEIDKACSFLRKSAGEKRAKQYAENQTMKFKQSRRMRHIHMTSASTGHKYTVVVDKRTAPDSAVSGGNPDSYGFSGKEHTVYVPDPEMI